MMPHVFDHVLKKARKFRSLGEAVHAAENSARKTRNLVVTDIWTNTNYTFGIKKARKKCETSL